MRNPGESEACPCWAKGRQPSKAAFRIFLGEKMFEHNTKGHCHPRASSAKTRGFHTQLDEGPESP